MTPHLTETGCCSECGRGGRHLSFPPENEDHGDLVAVCTYCDVRLYELTPDEQAELAEEDEPETLAV